MAINRPDIHGESLSAMRTADLEALLQAEMDSDQGVNPDRINVILAALDERTEQKSFDVDAAWEEFVRDYAPGEPLYPLPEETPPQTKEQPKRKHLYRLGLIAAVLAVFLLGANLTAHAAGFDLWGALVQWTSETFGFSFTQERDKADVQYNPELSELINALVLYGVPDQIAPRYLPDGYTQQELYVESGYYVGVYHKGDSDIIIQIRRIDSNLGGQFEQDNTIPEVYTVNSVDHHITTNLGNYMALWTNAGYECIISGVSDKIELIRMIDSIYVEEA